jgi:hypothetical protein
MSALLLKPLQCRARPFHPVRARCGRRTSQATRTGTAFRGLLQKGGADYQPGDSLGLACVFKPSTCGGKCSVGERNQSRICSLRPFAIARSTRSSKVNASAYFFAAAIPRPSILPRGIPGRSRVAEPNRQPCRPTPSRTSPCIFACDSLGFAREPVEESRPSLRGGPISRLQ